MGRWRRGKDSHSGISKRFPILILWDSPLHLKRCFESTCILKTSVFHMSHLKADIPILRLKDYFKKYILISQRVERV